MLRVPKPPCQKDSILTPETDFEDWLIGTSIVPKAMLRGVAFFVPGICELLGDEFLVVKKGSTSRYCLFLFWLVTGLKR